MPSFPKSGEMTNWIYSLGTGVVAAGFFGDELEVAWLRECWSKTFDQLESSDLDGAKYQIRWKRLDCLLSRALQGMVKSSGESLSEDVTLKAREYAHKNNILRGRHSIWMMIDYFKSNRSLQEQYTWQDIESLHWQGDEKVQRFYTLWKLIATSLSITIPEVICWGTFLSKIRSSKKLQADIAEFDRMREDDDRITLKCQRECMDRLLARDRMEWARTLHKKSLTSGAIDADSAPGHSGKGKGGGKKGKGKGQAKGKGKRRGKRDQSRESSGSNKQRGICHMHV